MVARIVPRYLGTQAARKAHAPPQQSPEETATSPEDVLRLAHANSIAGVIDQIAQVASHAFEIFSELRVESDKLGDRFEALGARLDAVSAALDSDPHAQRRLPSADVSDRVLRVRELSFEPPHAKSAALRALYDQCEPLPPFELLAEFCPDVTQCRKKYSHPEFFADDWMQRETFQQQQAQRQREERRRQRRDQRRSSQAAASQLQAPATSNPSEPGATPATETPESEKERLAMQQKMKFLNIRSWKERYGTGEGKEFLKPPTPKEKLPGKRRSTRKSVSLAKEDDDGKPETVAAGTTGDGEHAPTTCDVGTGGASEPVAKRTGVGGSNAHRASPVYSGAFMQEIEDPGELELDSYALEPETTHAPFPGQQIEQIAFADHGLSYFDPRTDTGQPPPHPPSPPLPVPATSQLLSESDEEGDWASAPPPPPPPPPPMHERRSFVAPSGAGYATDPFLANAEFVPPPPPPPPAPPLQHPRLSALELQVDLDDVELSPRTSFVPPPPPPPPPPLAQQTRVVYGDETPPPPPPISAPPARPAAPPLAIRMPSLLQELQSKKTELRRFDAAAEQDIPPPPPPSGILSPRLNLLQQIRMKQQLRPVAPPPPRTTSSRGATPNISAPFASSIARILERREMIAYDSDDGSDAGSDQSNDSDNDWK